MPPKIDPYATRGARIFDLFLCLLAIVLLLVATRTAPQNRSAVVPDREPDRAAVSLATR